MSLGFALGNYVYLSNTMINIVKSIQEITGFSSSISSTFLYIAMFILLFLIVEPEKMKPIAYFLSVCVFGAGNQIS